MKWLRYCVVMLSFIFFSPVSNAGQDPVGWRISAGGIPATSQAFVVYNVTYEFKNNMPFPMVTPLFIAIASNPNSEFSVTSDPCHLTTTGKSLAVGEICSVAIKFAPLINGNKSITLSEEYGRNVVPLPTISTVTPSFLTPSTTTPLPATMGAGERRPFVFTYTNNTNGNVTNINASAPVVITSVGINGSIIGQTTNCPSTLSPGGSCTVSGIFQAGTAPAPNTLYTLTDTVTTDGGPATATTSTQVTVLITGAMVPGFNFSNPMGAGQTVTLKFRFTNTDLLSEGTAYGLQASTFGPFVTGTGGSAVNGADGCNISTLAPGAFCDVLVTFTAGDPSVGNYSAQVSLNYLGGTVPLITTAVAADQTTFVNTVDFPNPMGFGEQQPFSFTFTNNGTVGPITPSNVTLTYIGGTLVTGSLSDGCTGTAVSPNGGTCVVSGVFQSNDTGPFQVKASLTYPGVTKMANTSSRVGTMLVVGSLTPDLPNPTGAGEQQAFGFTFTNTNTVGTAVGMTPVVTVPQGGTVTNFTTDCATKYPGGTLPAGGFCVANGTFNSGVAGNYKITGNLTFAGGTATIDTSTRAGTILVVGSLTPDLPNPMGAGEQEPFGFTFTNTNTVGVAYGMTPVVTAPQGGTVTGFTTDCATKYPGAVIPAGGFCVANGTFKSGAPGNYKITGNLVYAGGTATKDTTTVPGTIKITGSLITGLPANVVTSQTYPVLFTYTNNGPGTAYNIVDPTSIGNLITTNGTCSSPTTTCGTTLNGAPNPPNTCSVQCTFKASSTGAASVSSTLSYAGGTTSPAIVTSTTAVLAVVGSKPVDLPPSTTALTSYPITFAFKNISASSVTGGPTTVAALPITVSPGPSSQLTGEALVSCTDPLLSNQTCFATINFTPATAATPYTVTAIYSYTGDFVVVTASTTTTFARKFNIVNYCGGDVWFSFNGAPTRKGCSDKNPCANGSVCNKDADNGKGVCYWAQPMLAKGSSLHLGPMTALKPTTATVMVPDLDKKNSMIWSGSVAGRTGCKGSNCETADCNSGSGDKACPPGNKFNLPATTAEFTLNRSKEDKYSIQAANGVNLSMSMGPTNPDKTTPAYNGNNPYYCATPGSADASRIFKSCSWMLKPPAYPNASSAVNYVWVTPGKGGACSTNACPGTEVCGLSYAGGKFAKVCGIQKGYWTASQACLLNAVDASAYFDCKSAMTQPAGEVLQALNACTNTATQTVSGQSSACVGAGNKEIVAMVQWIKSACPSVSAFSGDTANSSFTCKTDEPETKANAKSETKMNVTEYTITFCPEMAPNSPFRNVRGTASNP